MSSQNHLIPSWSAPPPKRFIFVHLNNIRAYFMHVSEFYFGIHKPETSLLALEIDGFFKRHSSFNSRDFCLILQSFDV